MTSKTITSPNRDAVDSGSRNLAARERLEESGELQMPLEFHGQTHRLDQQHSSSSTAASRPHLPAHSSHRSSFAESDVESFELDHESLCELDACESEEFDAYAYAIEFEDSLDDDDVFGQDYWSEPSDVHEMARSVVTPECSDSDVVPYTGPSMAESREFIRSTRPSPVTSSGICDVVLVAKPNVADSLPAEDTLTTDELPVFDVIWQEPELELTIDLEDGSNVHIGSQDDDDTLRATLIVPQEEDAALKTTIIYQAPNAKSKPLAPTTELDVMHDFDMDDVEISQELDVYVDIDEEFEALDQSFQNRAESSFEADDAESAFMGIQAAKRENSWGGMAVFGLTVCGICVSANFLILLSGLSTMWSGAEPAAPVAALINLLSGPVR